jgi:hypothetical protein
MQLYIGQSRDVKVHSARLRTTNKTCAANTQPAVLWDTDEELKIEIENFKGRRRVGVVEHPGYWNSGKARMSFSARTPSPLNIT